MLFSGDGLSKLLTFALGMDTIPPLGFHPEPHIKFSHPADYVEGHPRAQYPYANTCSNTFFIPVLKPYTRFKKNMLATINTDSLFTDQ